MLGSMTVSNNGRTTPNNGKSTMPRRHSGPMSVLRPRSRQFTVSSRESETLSCVVVKEWRAMAETKTALSLKGSPRVLGGVVHKLPRDLRDALVGKSTALRAWSDITPLARNEFICWVEDAKRVPTRERRIRRTIEELEEGQRRPCCWPGCKHRERTGS